jgi:hypothetical protein
MPRYLLVVFKEELRKTNKVRLNGRLGGGLSSRGRSISDVPFPSFQVLSRSLLGNRQSCGESGRHSSVQTSTRTVKLGAAG